MRVGVREGLCPRRARRPNTEDALGLVMLELNILTDELKERRLGALEATALLRRVMGEIDVAVFAFDQDAALRLVNPSGKGLLGQGAQRLLGRTATALCPAACSNRHAPPLLNLPFPPP